MLRNLLLTGLTAIALASLATTAHADRGPTAPRRKTEAGKEARAGAARRVAKRLQGAAVNQSLLRQSWTIADLNPMPALLDLDDTAKSLRRATAEIARLMTR